MEDIIVILELLGAFSMNEAFDLSRIKISSKVLCSCRLETEACHLELQFASF